jgi:hypothetical protein
MIQLTNFDLNKNQLLNTSIHNLASAPATPVVGQMYYNTADGKLYYRNASAWVALEASAGAYTLPIATDAVLGGVKDGTGLTIDGTGVISVDYGSAAGTAVVGNDARVTADQAAATASIRTIGAGALQAAAGNHTHTAYSLPIATAAVLGGVKDGAGITIDAGGVINVDYGTTANTAVVGNDTRVTADQAAATASIRTLGTGAAQAAAGNHTHTSLGSLTITGDLVVNGTTTTLNTTELAISDNKITLNSDVTAAPTEDAGIVVERGTSTNVEIAWNETNDVWTLTNDGTNFASIARKYSYALGALTAVVVTHNLNTRDLVAAVYRSTTPWDVVYTDVEMTSVNTVTVRFAVAPTAGEYTLVLVG